MRSNYARKLADLRLRLEVAEDRAALAITPMSGAVAHACLEVDQLARERCGDGLLANKCMVIFAADAESGIAGGLPMPEPDVDGLLERARTEKPVNQGIFWRRWVPALIGSLVRQCETARAATVEFEPTEVANATENGIDWPDD